MDLGDTMTELPPFMSFREACEAMAEGKRVRRLGSTESYSLRDGRLIRHARQYSRSSASLEEITFTLVEQASGDWLITDTRMEEIPS
jgi:hypothetical protein